MKTYRNISIATVGIVDELLEQGAEVVVRGNATREFLARHTRIERPLERYLFLPRRNNDIVAQFAETMWVLAGRDDVAWLERYLPRAPEFSDDGKVWHGAYGPRLRRWGAIDQIDEVRKILSADRSSRQAVMSLFDPGRDFTASKDIPCNNWLGWIIREDRLHLHVALRSNDAWWGFSGANSFEWSILHEMMAFWLGADAGSADYFAMSLHLYDRHFDRGGRMVSAAHGVSPYDHGVGRAAFATPWPRFDRSLARWFELEARIASDPSGAIGSYGCVGDPLLDSALTLVHVRWAHRAWGPARLAQELAALPPCDYVAALYQQFGRLYPEILDDIPQQPIARFFDAIRNRAEPSATNLTAAIKRLHAEKDRAYGGAWKRRGELVSILPNIARKADRLETMMATGATLAGETALDTLVDLLVYAHKYRLWLAERLAPGALLSPGAATPLSDHDANFDAILDVVDLAPTGRRLKTVVEDIVAAFQRCWRRAEAGAAPAERLELAGELARHAAEALALLAECDKEALSNFLRVRSAA